MRTMEQFIMVQSQKFEQLINSVESLVKKLDKITNNEPEWLNSEKTCFMLSISKRSLANYVSQGILHCSKINGLNYFKRSEIIELLNKNYK